MIDVWLRKILLRTQQDGCAVRFAAENSDGAGQWSYRELGGSIAKIQTVLRTVNPRVIGILGQKNAETYAAVVASLGCGVPFVPLNSRWPQGKIRNVAIAANVDFILTDSACRELAVAMGIAFHVVQKEHAANEWEIFPIENTSEAYRIFTSGSTGDPKGVLVSRDNLSAALEGLAGSYPASSSDRFSQCFDLSFDLAIGEILWALSVGGCLCPLDSAEVPFLARYFDRERITIWGSTPSLARMALRTLSGTSPFPHLQFSLFCGEKLTTDLAKLWRQHAPNSEITNFYGPTEATLYVTRFTWIGEHELTDENLPLGSAFAGSKIELVDDRGEPQADSGEIWIGGRQVAMGYLANNAEDKSSFVYPRWAPTERWYRTGDQGRRNARSELFFAGRRDSQVKILGHRLELGEIENQLSKIRPGQWIAFPEWDESAQANVGIMVAHDFFLGREEVIRVVKALRDALPSALVPRKIYYVPIFPLSTSGKLDRARIAAMMEARSAVLLWPSPAQALRTCHGEVDPLRSLKTIAPDFSANYYGSVQRHADRPFLTFITAIGESETRSFEDFDEDVSRVRFRLNECFCAEEPVCLVSPNSYMFAVFATAILLEGFSLCLLNPHENEDRLLEKTAKFSRQFCLHPSLIKTFPQIAKQSLAMEIPTEAKRRREPGRPFGEKPFVLIFTSGTTGYSKIVEQLETGVMMNVDALIGHHALNESSVIGTPLPLFHVNAFEFSFLCCLFSGAHFVLFESFHPRILIETSTRFRISLLSLIPDMIRLLCAARWPPMPWLRSIVTAAAPLPPDVARDALEKLPARVLQGYGLSEAVNFSLLFPRDLSAPEHAHWMTSEVRPSAGIPLAGNDVFVLDENSIPQGEGITGDIAIRGFNVMKGYRAVDNGEVFLSDYLRTGDRGFYKIARDGRPFFFITGRNKDVIKRLGTTISLVEIDDILGRLAAPTKAIAVNFDRPNGAEDVGVVVQNADENDLGLNELIDYIEREIPDYMRPRAICITRDAVKTPSGKPCRWKFRAFFQEASHRIGGKKIVYLGEGSATVNQ